MPEPTKEASAADIARRRIATGRPLNTVMKTAATACELARARGARDPRRDASED
jgi:hypothetical protein